jgi:ParB-like chromosome segregation protein Spo0J
MKTQQIPLERLLEADWNANRVSKTIMAKLRRSILDHGVVENLVARPHPRLGTKSANAAPPHSTEKPAFAGSS